MKINIPSIGVTCVQDYSQTSVIEPVDPLKKYTFFKSDGEWQIKNSHSGHWMSVSRAHNGLRLAEYTGGESTYLYTVFVDWAMAVMYECNERFKQVTGQEYDFSVYGELATSAEASSPAPKKGKKKMRDFEYDYDMGETFATSMAGKKLDHLTSRLYQVTDTKDHELRKQFGLVDDDAPKNPKELVERIQAGKFTLPEKADDRYSYDPLRGLRWRSPDLKEDKDGFRAARDLLDKETDKARDAIMILDPKDGLAALQALEAWTPTGAAH